MPCHHAYLHILLLCLAVQFCLPRHAAAQVDEQQVLLRIKNAWGSPPALASWSSASSHCTGWAHVTCDGAGQVTSLSLPNVAVTGPLPDAIGELTGLVTLNLQNTSVSGGFPSFLYNCTASPASTSPRTTSLATSPPTSAASGRASPTSLSTTTSSPARCRRRCRL
jgi:hypothetical protein